MERGSSAAGWLVRTRLVFRCGIAELLPACSGCDARLIRLAKPAARQPASIGRLRAGSLETRVNTGLAGRGFGDGRFTRDSGQALWRVLLWAAAGRDDAFFPHDRRCKALLKR